MIFSFILNLYIKMSLQQEMNMFPSPGPLKIFPVEEQHVNHAASYLGLPWKLAVEAIVTKSEGQCQLTDER